MEMIWVCLFVVAVVGAVIGFEVYIKPKFFELKSKLKEKL